ncbi:MAG: LPXTG cell wall anchor domain-containing protein [Aerococcus sp.]|nr:LPXTG cell wall anchor domain-containing protein [Aerococcus sp.]
MELKKLGLGLASVAVAATLVNNGAVKAAENENVDTTPKVTETAEDQAAKDLAAKKAALIAKLDSSSLPSGRVYELTQEIKAAKTLDAYKAVEAKVLKELEAVKPEQNTDKELEAKKAALIAKLDSSSLPSGRVYELTQEIKAAKTLDAYKAVEAKVLKELEAVKPEQNTDKELEAKKAALIAKLDSSSLPSGRVYELTQEIKAAKTMDAFKEVEAKVLKELEALKPDKDDNQDNDKPETPAVKEYTVKYVVKDKDGKEVKVLQTETWNDWKAMEQGSVVVANSYMKEYGNWDVIATAEGLTYVFTQKEETPDTPAVKEYTVKYVVKDKDGKEVKVLQTETWNDWKAMEQGSVVVANSYMKEYGNWDVIATAEGLTYVFTAKEDTPSTPDKPETPDKPGTPDKPSTPDNKPGKEDGKEDSKEEHKGHIDNKTDKTNKTDKKENKAKANKKQMKKNAAKLPQTGATAAGLGLGLTLSAVGSVFAFKKRQ